MKRKIYFFSAVTTALILPVLFGGIYFRDLYIQNKDKMTLARLNSKPDIYYDSNEIITNLEDVPIKDEQYESANYFDFQVVYSDSNKSSYEYSLYLNDIELSPNINPELFRWRLFMLDNKKEEYTQLSSGDFVNLNNKIRISEDIKIGLNTVQRFRLYYYLVEDVNNTVNYVGSTFEARIKVE